MAMTVEIEQVSLVVCSGIEPSLSLKLEMGSGG